ncbi:uncharacterized protein LOC120438473 isoform X1 [Oreochromis aureus]|uniref:uncharacterized protein LOC120438473 isoform X1 n=2 Tax=Oreochromis aureus TaxID=47969 RepID=UPI001953AEA8|nr:uncharacterized protein LOC120438473 isoform X1 [Oreochromis aureus]XP_039464807.1 uncharacterized protein LOC120438473 isoform X1 [Oreochromis aureus]
MIVHVYSNRSDQLKKQDGLYRDRTKMNEDLLRTGDLSLTLKYPTERDSGGYICTIYRDKDILRQKVVLQVKEPFPSWAKALLILLVLVLVLGGVLFLFRHIFRKVFFVLQVEVESGAESVLLPCKTTFDLPEDVKVEWTDRDNRTIHVYHSGSDQPDEQDWLFKDRTRMNEDTLKTGDLSLTVNYPIQWNRDICTCTVYSSEGSILMKKRVELKVRDCQVEVEEGVDSVQLPFETTGDLPGDTKVEWRRTEPKTLMTVHIYQNGSDQPEEQNQDYRDRTKMNEDLLKTGDLSLTLKHPTDGDSGRYRCGAYRRESNMWREKTVLLRVKGEFKSGIKEGRSSSADATHLIADQSV